ncbi:DUF202 domain-containing protein [Marinilongibacter aquaticus]|uniref:DUF202 domain-containing protein n=1 Tax=Marinilongibacter aquaticus TaxID=2975157 RepID=UPI0021BD03F1|nr:DUF202 domain-containing protein [Marinilongibacter aquaticus]UBM59889.1 DUF202 domain-containing protein [Marinilongibacter aquaticus]
MKSFSELSLGDKLAIERTKLANERTFLAYFRTAFVFLISGVTVIKMDYFFEIRWLGFTFILLFPVVVFIGALRLNSVRKKINSSYL